ncbi:hypothetical protein OEZ85_002964 [Tetradesmus obliquus]|uniref:FCP1 homology domain-containing protein n=1 Tax=Tetradesmus obliquus TaxID=3088 RepID=A0ABY8U1E7_TETOB|nr:hypothetical protein OEZ85_002964 [Tetradesmus obliquus]
MVAPVMVDSPLAFEREFEHILIDLDDTLYRNEEIPQTVRQNIQDYMVAKLGIPQDQVQQLTQELYLAQGTTMAGLIALGYSIDFDDWHAHVHGSLDYQKLLHNQPATRQALQEMCVQQHILTNADAKHTAACLTQMGLTGCFQSIWCFENVMDLARSKGLLTPSTPVMCKPSKQVYELVMEQLGAQPRNTLFIDDSPRNVAAAHELGIFTVLVSPALAAQQQPQHQPVAGADLVVSRFTQLRELLPQLFEQRKQQLEGVPAGVPVSVMAS